ncbi:MAG: hypothetical protein EA390_03865 [Balneolaceae bacterium]|nr:MAG: hypothetical protein EA390_03865 [Balneolaceae bacterium]
MTTKTKTILAFLTIFIIGFASGILISNTNMIGEDRDQSLITERGEGERWQQFRGGDRREQPERAQQRTLNRMAEYLELQEDQRDELFGKMREYRMQLRDEMREFRASERETIRTHYESFREEAAEILNREQIMRLDSFLHPDSVRHRRAMGDWERSR